jgi:hypothetical protein
MKLTTCDSNPAPQTQCANGGRPGQVVTVTVNQGGAATATQTNIVYSTTHLTGTVWVG